jgi:eukaryotic-like serine/threonine-protein kinase
MNIELVTDIAKRLAASKEHWGIPNFIDAGASGAVFALEHPKFGKVALKVYDPAFFSGDNAVIEKARVELQVKMADLDHKNLIKVIEANEIPESGTWYVLMEFCAWPSLDKKIGDFPNDQVQPIISQIADALKYLQQNELIHRDIKPANILISEDYSEAKVVDFGVVRPTTPGSGNGTDEDGKKRFVATAQYSPPEFILRDAIDPEIEHDAINVYQVGAVLHDLIMKRPIFEDEAHSQNRYILFRAIMNKKPTVIAVDVPARLGSICRAALEKIAAKRVAAVCLDDFIANVDNVDVLRSRLAAQKNTRLSGGCPSLVVWSRKAEAWLAEAAVSEQDVLGPHVKHRIGEGVWTLEFPAQQRCIEARLSPTTDQNALHFQLSPVGASDAPLSVLEIGVDGPSIPSDQINSQLVEQILFLLDSIPAG